MENSLTYFFKYTILAILLGAASVGSFWYSVPFSEGSIQGAILIYILLLISAHLLVKGLGSLTLRFSNLPYTLRFGLVLMSVTAITSLFGLSLSSGLDGMIWVLSLFVSGFVSLTMVMTGLVYTRVKSKTGEVLKITLMIILPFIFAGMFWFLWVLI